MEALKKQVMRRSGIGLDTPKLCIKDDLSYRPALF